MQYNFSSFIWSLLTAAQKVLAENQHAVFMNRICTLFLGMLEGSISVYFHSFYDKTFKKLSQWCGLVHVAFPGRMIWTLAFSFVFLCEKYAKRFHQKSTSSNQTFIVLNGFGNYKLLCFFSNSFTELNNFSENNNFNLKYQME